MQGYVGVDSRTLLGKMFEYYESSGSKNEKKIMTIDYFLNLIKEVEKLDLCLGLIQDSRSIAHLVVIKKKPQGKSQNIIAHVLTGGKINLPNAFPEEIKGQPVNPIEIATIKISNTSPEIELNPALETVDVGKIFDFIWKLTQKLNLKK